MFYLYRRLAMIRPRRENLAVASCKQYQFRPPGEKMIYVVRQVLEVII